MSASSSSTVWGLAVRFRLLFAVIIIALLTLIVQAEPRAGNVATVDYFAGKDETCHELEISHVTGIIRQVVAIINFYGAGDNELSCTLAIQIEGSNVDSRYSASASTCSPLLRERPNEVLTFVIADDHVCSIKKVRNRDIMKKGAEK